MTYTKQTIIIIIIMFKYPGVYNARGSKTERIKTAEMTRGPECHQWSHCAKIVVLQQTGAGKESTVPPDTRSLQTVLFWHSMTASGCSNNPRLLKMCKSFLCEHRGRPITRQAKDHKLFSIGTILHTKKCSNWLNDWWKVTLTRYLTGGSFIDKEIPFYAEK